MNIEMFIIFCIPLVGSAYIIFFGLKNGRRKHLLTIPFGVGGVVWSVLALATNAFNFQATALEILKHYVAGTCIGFYLSRIILKKFHGGE